VVGEGPDASVSDAVIPNATVTASEPSRRLFFALWPDETLRSALAEAVHEAVHGVVEALDGRPIPASNFHVTLVFIGSVIESRIRELIAIAERVADDLAVAGGEPARQSESPVESDWPGVQLTFDGIEYWPKPKIICATASVPSVPATALADVLKAHLTDAGFAPDLKPFRAHITLARKVPLGSHEQSMRSVLWSFAEFALVDSQTESKGSVYTVLQSFPLGARRRSAP
jgi:2'-5' RNA ligase